MSTVQAIKYLLFIINVLFFQPYWDCEDKCHAVLIFTRLDCQLQYVIASPTVMQLACSHSTCNHANSIQTTRRLYSYSNYYYAIAMPLKCSSCRCTLSYLKTWKNIAIIKSIQYLGSF